MSIFRKTMKALGFSGEDDEFEKKSDRIMRVTLLRLLRELEKTKRRNCNSPIRCSIHC